MPSFNGDVPGTDGSVCRGAMHELSIAQSIVETVLREMEQRNLNEVRAIGLRIGALSGVMVEALQFSYDVIVKETPLERTRLEIEQVPVRARCNACGNEFQVDEPFFLCPACNSGDVDVLSGQELDIAYLEVDE